jgi:hypothetical protein
MKQFFISVIRVPFLDNLYDTKSRNADDADSPRRKRG